MAPIQSLPTLQSRSKGWRVGALKRACMRDLMAFESGRRLSKKFKTNAPRYAFEDSGSERETARAPGVFCQEGEYWKTIAPEVSNVNFPTSIPFRATSKSGIDNHHSSPQPITGSEAPRSTTRNSRSRAERSLNRVSIRLFSG